MGSHEFGEAVESLFDLSMQAFKESWNGFCADIIRRMKKTGNENQLLETMTSCSFGRRTFLCAAAVGVGLLLGGCSNGSDDDLLVAANESTDSSEEFSPSVALLDVIPDGLATFSLTGDDEPSLSAEMLANIQEAIDSVETSADAGFVLIDMDRGTGLAYNVDTAVYGASSFKAPYALYLCEDLQDNGLVDLTDADLDRIEAAILYSDNDAYVTLRDAYDSVDFDAWVTSLGVEDALYREDSHYPWYCARSSAKLWTEMFLYVQKGSERALWLQDLLSNTETSFFRLELGQTGATMWSKPGWCAGSSDVYDSICEAGIVELDGRTYLLSVMTGLHYDDERIDSFYRLVGAVFAARDELETS